MAAFGGYTHESLPRLCTPRQLIALLQQAKRERRRRHRLATAAAIRAALDYGNELGDVLARLEAE